MIPDFNNVYGEIHTPQGLQRALAAVQLLVGQDRAYIYRSGYNGAETLHVRTADAEFDSEPFGGTGHLISGGVAGSPEEVVVYIRSLSDALEKVGVEYRFEVYDERRLFAEVAHAPDQRNESAS